MARLVISSPAGKRGILELTRAVLTVGRSCANDLVLNDPSVSRYHAIIKTEEGRVMVADRGSTNGVLLNGVLLTEEAALRDRDHIRIGEYDIRFEAPEDASVVMQPAQLPAGVDEVLKGAPLAPTAEELAGAVSEPSEKIRRLERENYLLRFLCDAGKALNSKLAIEDVAEQVISLCFRIEAVQRGFMMLFDRDGGVSHQTEVRYRHPPADDSAKIILSRTIVEAIRQDREPILIADAHQDERFLASDSMKMSGLRSAMCAPLVGPGGKLYGLLYVDNMEQAHAFTNDELSVFALVAAQAAAAIDNAQAHRQLAEQAVQRSALERFLSPDVVDMIAANAANIRLGGANQKVSILFADIRGFTEISEQLPPQRVVEILNEFFTRVTDVVFDHGGTLDKYIGDGVLALFGAPLSKGNDAANAVRAAIAIQMMIDQLNRDARVRDWPELRLGIGINTGVVIAGNIGSMRRIDYTVIGDAVNVAARLVAGAGTAQILITEDTRQELDASFNVGPLPPMLVKGKSQPIPVFAVRWRALAHGAGQ